MEIPATRADVPTAATASWPVDRCGLILQERYRIVRHLGRGGMGEVYEGYHELIGKRLAIKCLHAHVAHDPNALERLKREARAATAVGNEHIVDVTDMGVFPDGCPYIVMEYLEGRELADLIEHAGPFTVSRAVNIALQICDALSAVHAQGIVHRDLKPQNVFLVKRKNTDDFVKILDFGVSKVHQGADVFSTQITRAGTLVGTPHYMAPEQVVGAETIDHRVDIYALGVMTYLGLAGKVPFDGGSLHELFIHITTQEATPLSELRKDIPQTLSDVIQHALAKDPDQRYSTADDFAQALEPFVGCGHQPTASDFGRPSTDPVKAKVPRSSDRPLPVRADKTSNKLAERPSRTGRSRKMVTAAVTFTAAAVAFGYFLLDPSTVADLQRRSSGEVVRTTQVLRVQAPANARDFQINKVTQQSTAGPEDRAVHLVDTVRVQLRTDPANAMLEIDGKEYPNPLDARLPRSTEPVRVLVSRSGYRRLERVVLFDQPKELSFKLTPHRSRLGRTSAGSDSTSTPAPRVEKALEGEQAQPGLRKLRTTF